MTDTIDIPDYVTVVKSRSIADLAATAAGLLAEHSDLPAPHYLTVSQCGQELGLQFRDSPETFRAMAQWADRFGGAVTADPCTRDGNGQQSIHTQVTFIDQGVTVRAYAFITVEPGRVAGLLGPNFTGKTTT